MDKQDPAPSTRTGMPARSEWGGTIWEPLQRLRGEFDRLYDDLIVRPGGMPMARRMFGMTVPPISMTRSEDGYELTVELPGIEPAAVEITLADDVIRIRGEKKEAREEKDKDYFFSERRYGSFERAVELPADADPNSIDASFSNGLLTIRMKRDVKAQPAERKIEIKTS